MLLCVYMLCTYLGVLYFGCSAHCKWRVGGRKGVARLLLLVVDLLSGCFIASGRAFCGKVVGEVTIVHGTSLRFFREKSLALVFWSSRRGDYFALFSDLVRLVGLAVKGPSYQRGFFFCRPNLKHCKRKNLCRPTSLVVWYGYHFRLQPLYTWNGTFSAFVVGLDLISHVLVTEEIDN